MKKALTEFEYNQAEGIRRSDLWKMEDSPEKFRYFLDHPVEQTPAMAFGSACHKFILENEEFPGEYALAPEVDKRTKAGKEEWEAFMASIGDRKPITKEDNQVMVDMYAAIERCPLAKKLILGKGSTEEAFFWTDPETGERCKIKVDRLVKYNRRWYVVDYKTTACAETFRFNSDIFSLGYHFQAGMYTEGVMIAKKLKKRPGFLFVAQEKKAPYSVNVIEVSEEVMNAGVAKFHQLMDKYHNCKALDSWPGYVSDVPNDAFVPGWAEREMEDEI